MSIIPLAGPAGHYVNWWVVHISVTNLTIIVVMVVVFVLALVLPFPGHDQEEDAPMSTSPSWTVALRDRLSRTVPPGQVAA